MKHSLMSGRWVGDGEPFVVQDKFLLKPYEEVASVTRAQVTQAVAGLRDAAARGAPSPAERAASLRRAADILESRRQLFIDTMVAEAGFTLPDASVEVDRAKITLQLCAEEAPRLVGDVVPFAASPGAHHRIGFTMRSPLGVVCAITPFNSPLNTVLHKVGPAYGAGNAVVLKPSALTPLTSARLGQVLLDAGVPPEFLAILQGDGDSVGRWLLEEPDIAFYTFTGSTRVGRIIQDAAGLRRTQMELGSIASTLVCASADQDKAAEKIANAAFRKAGQVCTSVQRLYVHADIIESFTSRLVDCARSMPAGDPRQATTRVGPLISEAAAIRSAEWISQAQQQGAKVLCGGERSGAVLTPTVISGIRGDTTIWCQEAFAPIVALRPFTSLTDAVQDANGTPYGLAAGIFSADIHECMQAARQLRFGTVQINETSSARSDVMPFGGVKDSGFGKEGPWHAMREMTEERLVVINP